MAGVGSKSRDVECISSSFSPRGVLVIDLSFVSSVSRDTRDAPETDIAKADKPTMGIYRRRFQPELPPCLDDEEEARAGTKVSALRAREAGCTLDEDARIAVIIVPVAGPVVVLSCL